MGNFYTNITLRGPGRDAVLDILRGDKRYAYVSQTRDFFSVVYDSETEGQDEAVLCRLAELLSRKLACPALAVLNHDDDVLIYHLYVRGEKVDSYDSAPGYFSGELTRPSGGNVAALIEAFSAPCDPQTLAAILMHSPTGAGQGSAWQSTVASGFEEWIARIRGNPDLVAQLLTGRLSDDALAEIGKMRDEIFDGVQRTASYRSSPVVHDKYLFAVDRHRDLIEALGLPPDAVGTGYKYIENGEYPDGAGKEDFIHT